MFKMHVCPTFEYVVYGKDENIFETCILKNFEFENLLREDFKIFNDDFYTVHSKIMCIEQNVNSFENIFINSVLVHDEVMKLP